MLPTPAKRTAAVAPSTSATATAAPRVRAQRARCAVLERPRPDRPRAGAGRVARRAARPRGRRGRGPGRPPPGRAPPRRRELHRPGVAALRLARLGHAHARRASAAPAARRVRPDARQQRRALAGRGVDVEHGGQPADRAQARARGAARSSGRPASARARSAMPGPRSSASISMPRSSPAASGAQEHLAAARVLARGWWRPRSPRGPRVPASASRRSPGRRPAAPASRRASPTWDSSSSADAPARSRHYRGGCHHFQRTTVTRVPCPGADEMANSFISRLAPPRPRPRPLPVVKPSCRASSTSGMPGPWSSKVRRRPRRRPSFSDLQPHACRRRRRSPCCAPARWRR